MTTIKDPKQYLKEATERETYFRGMVDKYQALVEKSQWIRKPEGLFRKRCPFCGNRLSVDRVDYTGIGLDGRYIHY